MTVSASPLEWIWASVSDWVQVLVWESVRPWAAESELRLSLGSDWAWKSAAQIVGLRAVASAERAEGLAAVLLPPDSFPVAFPAGSPVVIVRSAPPQIPG